MEPSGIAATPEPEAKLGFDPPPWGDFFIEYEPKPLQVTYTNENLALISSCHTRII
jgi:hypothetical protein